MICSFEDEDDDEHEDDFGGGPATPSPLNLVRATRQELIQFCQAGGRTYVNIVIGELFARI